MKIFCSLLSFFLIPALAIAQPVSKQVVRLGATLPLSGDIASYGKLIKDGIDFAISDLTLKGYGVTVRYEDIPLPGPNAVIAINKLISSDKIQALAGNFWNPVIPIMAPAIKHSGIIAFHTAIADDLILNAGDSIFSTNGKIKDEASKLANYARAKMGSKMACILYIGTTFGENYEKHFKSEFEKLGGKISYSELTKLGDNDLRSVLLKVQKNLCDTWFAAYFGTNLGLVLKQAHDIKLDKPVLSVYEAEDPSVIDVAGVGAEGLKFFVPESKTDTKVISDFKDRFFKQFGYQPRILGSNSYDATVILVKALAECNGDSKCAQDKIYSIKNYDGVSGNFSIDPDGAADKEFVLKTVKDGKFVRLY